LARNSGTETQWKNGYGSRNITSKLNESVKEKVNPEVFFFYDKNIDLANTKKKNSRVLPVSQSISGWNYKYTQAL
jgi:hypothetical protein